MPLGPGPKTLKAGATVPGPGIYQQGRKLIVKGYGRYGNLVNVVDVSGGMYNVTLAPTTEDGSFVVVPDIIWPDMTYTISHSVYVRASTVDSLYCDVRDGLASTVMNLTKALPCTVLGSDGNDFVLGGGGADCLVGGGGDDAIGGGPGNDSIDGGAGNNVYLAGLGNDTIVMNANDVLIDKTPDDTVVRRDQ